MNNEKKNAIIVFLRAPQSGKVKTRLAARIGDEAALIIYKKLLKHTFHVLQGVDAHLFFFVTENNDSLQFPFPGYQFSVVKQSGKDLGHRMKNAFKVVLGAGYKRAIIIGTDNIQLLPHHIKQAFDILYEKEVVIGPSNDGGYYLLGMNTFFEEIFEDIEWSTESVYQKSIEIINQKGLTFGILPQLVDLDIYDDLLQISWQSVFQEIKGL